MRIRTYDEVDPDDVLRLTTVSFGWQMHPKWVRTVRARDPRYFEEYGYYAVEKRRPVAQVVPMRFPVRLETGAEEVGGVQAVCSHPARWGHGNIRLLMDRLHERFRELGFRISTLTTSRNIRGYTVYRGLGYVDLGAFYDGTRRIARPRAAPEGVQVRKATRRDISDILRLFETYTRDSLGWTIRVPEVIPAKAAWYPGYLDYFRMVVRDGHAVGYLVTRPDDDVLMEEVIVPRMNDFRAAVTVMERKARGRFATTTWITCRKDRERFRRIGYTVDGPTASATMALSLDKGLRTRDLPRLFGGTNGRFSHYFTEDF